ncbi:MAG: response regulator [Defluviitaleaceae bacterium]|nr:response regulator [Defluviitaleaceae bacterium]
MDLKKIIYVDDVYYSLVTMKERFKNKFDVYPAESMEKLFEVLEKITPDLILLDINMPEVNGFDVIKKLKADTRYTNIPVIFLTAQRDKRIALKGMALGAVDFITKPFSADKLIECIQYHLDMEVQDTDKPIILSIDDNPSILHAVSSLLEDDYTVYTLPEVKTEQVLTELLKKITPDLFLLDYNMPVLNGFELVPIIRKLPDHEDTPIIFLTSEGTVDHISTAVYLGVCDYIVKPIDKAVFREKIAAHLTDFIVRRRIRSLND